MEYRVYVYQKPYTSDIILYKTFTDAAAACTMIDGEIQEWAAFEGSGRMRLVRRWVRTRHGIVLMND
jgi:hypothetical protein